MHTQNYTHTHTYIYTNKCTTVCMIVLYEANEHPKFSLKMQPELV